MREIFVEKGTFVVTDEGGVLLIAKSLGSTLAICLRDTSSGIIGICVPVVPKVSTPDPLLTAFDCANGLREFFKEVMEKGAKRQNIKIWLVGVGIFFEGPRELNIGAQLYTYVKNTIERNGIKIVKEHVGGSYNRTVRFSFTDGPVITIPGEDEEVVL